MFLRVQGKIPWSPTNSEKKMTTMIEVSDDAPADISTSYTLEPNQEIQGQLHRSDDKDWFKTGLTTGTIHTVTVTGDAGITITLLDSTGKKILSGVPTPTGAVLEVNPSETTDYYIEIKGNEDITDTEYRLIIKKDVPLGTVDDLASYLTDGYWEHFEASRRKFNVNADDPTVTVNLATLSEDGKELARIAFESWTIISGLEFDYIETEDADLTFTNIPGNNAQAYSTVDEEGHIIRSEVNIPPDYLDKHGYNIDSFAFSTFVHEIGHAIGLGHPGPYNGISVTWGVHNVYKIDSWQYSIMSYLNQDINKLHDASFAYNVTPMIADIIATQALYDDLEIAHNAGDTVYGVNSNFTGYLADYFEMLTTKIETEFFSDIIDSDDPNPFIKLTFADFDNDKDLDLIIGELSTGNLRYFENTGNKDNPVYAEKFDAENPFTGFNGYFSKAPFAIDLNNDNLIDLVFTETHGGDDEQTIIFLKNTGTVSNPTFEKQIDSLDPFNGIETDNFTSVSLADLDNDNKPDLLTIRDSKPVYYKNTGTDNTPAFTETTGDNDPFKSITAAQFDTPYLVDVNNDGLIDMIAGSANGNIVYLKNTGTTETPEFTQQFGEDNPFKSLNTGYYTAPVLVDLNDDNNLELVISQQDDQLFYIENAGDIDNPEYVTELISNPTAFTLYDTGGADTIDFSTDPDDQVINLKPESISDVYGLTGNMTIARDTWIENAIAGAGNDVLKGNKLGNELEGNSGDDRLYGYAGEDTLEGGPGADRLYGSAGNDTLSGGPGNDRLSGGADADVFVFTPGDGEDIITDFTRGEDKIDLTAFSLDEPIDLSMTTSADGVTLDLPGADGGTVLLAGLDTNPGTDDFIV